MKKVLLLGSHCDDIELGCGATAHKHRTDWDMTAVTFCRTGVEGIPAYNVQELWKTSRASLMSLGLSDVRHLEFPICNYYKVRQEIWLVLRHLNEELHPNLVLTHWRDDSRDHQTLYDESIRNFEQADVYCYVPSVTTQSNFLPDVFEPVAEEHLEAKIRAVGHYDIYREKAYFHRDTIQAQAHMAGLLARCPLAESYKLFRKIGL